MNSNTQTPRLALLLLLVCCGACSSETAGDAGNAADALLADATTEAAPGGVCPTAPGPKMVWVPWPAGKGGGYCIDSTEVTQAQYAAFVAANVDPSTQSAKCAWNTAFAPDPECMQHLLGTPSPNLPQTCVDWCDSDAFCRWAGKRLCGGSGDKENDFNTSEWYNACSAGGTRLRPYGDDLKPYCNVRVSNGGQLVLLDVGSNPSCEGGSPGILNMLGNALEWTAECMAISGGESCWARGSNFRGNWPNEIDTKNPLDNPLCAEERKLTVPVFSGTHASLDGSVGFRCCANEVR
ncbi:MAG: SUMF1/EgtB/PvdO family nonheme iron enzyme [Deltaproteobacteria bacterium]|nr:SUMF1/EgtB/PvdO family nonheme iron enzyme [Deltaproteobacteria bacterium]